MIKPFIYKGMISKMGERKIINISDRVEHHYDLGEGIIVLKIDDYNNILKRGGLYESELRI